MNANFYPTGKHWHFAIGDVARTKSGELVRIIGVDSGYLVWRKCDAEPGEAIYHATPQNVLKRCDAN